MALRLVKSNPAVAAPRDPRAKWLLELGNDLDRALNHCRNKVDESAVHDARIAARRLRSVLRAVRDDMNPYIYESLRFDLKQVARSLAPARTAAMRQRQIKKLFTDANGDDGDRDDSSQLLELFARMVERRHREVAAQLQTDRWRARSERIATHLHDPELLLAPAIPHRDLCLRLLRCSVDDSVRALRKRKKSVVQLHRRRIALKNTRYVLETIAPAAALDAHDAIAALRKAQDALGEVNDWNGLARWLDSAAITTTLQRDIAKRAAKVRDTYWRRAEEKRVPLRRRLRELADSLGL